MVWGGFDLTPYILDEEDCKKWHEGAQAACEMVGTNFIKSLKRIVTNIFTSHTEKNIEVLAEFL